jgi:RNA polymerase sigma factor (sigma-70 family)
VAVDVTTTLPGGDPGRFLRNEPDEALVAHVLQGSEAAFEVIYDRHHRGLIAFCRHMLRSREEAEDALQHTFVAAYRSLTSGDRPNALKPWLYTIARNRCLTVMRARRTRDDAAATETPVGDGAVEGLSDAVQRRADLRDLVSDLHRLPEDQRAALVLFELGDHSHAEIADVLAVDRLKVKALVFQAREGLLRARTARDTPCAEVRKHLSSRTRALPRRGVIRGHLDTCPACAAYDLEVRRQRAALALALPVVPSLELKGSVLGPLVGGGATVAAGGAAAIGTGAAGTAVTTAGAGGAAGAGAAGGALTLAAGAGSGLTGGAAMTGLSALAANAVVAKVVTVVAVAGAAAGAGHVAGAMHHRSAPAKARTAPAFVAAVSEPKTIAAPPPPVVRPAVTPAAAVSHPAPAPAAAATPAAAAGAAAGAAATIASPSAAAKPPDPAPSPTGGTQAPPQPAESTPAIEPTDAGASGSAPSTTPETSVPPADPQPTVVADTVDPDPTPATGAATDPASSAPPVDCPVGTEPVDPTVTPTTTPTPPASPDPGTAPPVPTVTLPDGTAVPIPDGCVLVPPAVDPTAADQAVSPIDVGAAAAAAATASDAPPAP